MKTTWVRILIIALMLPLLAYPMLLSGAPDDSVAKSLVWIYPAYVICAGICAWVCYPERSEVTWILLFLLVLSHLGMYLL